MSNHHEIIIIGAGMAGLSAYVKLLEAGYTNVLLLEANDRIGGRINTIQLQNSFLELGAQWIHGTNGNPIYELSKLLNMIEPNVESDSPTIYVTQDGAIIDEDIVDGVYDKIENLFDNLDDMIENELEDESDESIGTLLDDGFVKVLKKLTKNDQIDIELIKSIYRARLNEERVETSCEDLRRLSALGWNEYEDFEGDQFTRLRYGFKRLVDYLASQIPKDLLRLNQVVEKIDWSFGKSNLIELATSNRLTQAKSVYTANYVLTTMPLGYLKNHHHTLFVPKLPLNKIKAIENLGFGCVNKLFIVFDKPLLNNSIEGLHILWRNDLTFNLDHSDSKWNLQGNKFYRSLDNFEVLPNLPNVLVCLLVGRDAIFIESLEENCLLDVVNELFKKCFAQLNLPSIKKIVHSKWWSDPFTNGSYSYIKTGSSIKDVKSLAQSLDNKIFFAGESTTYKYMSKVHGAYITGRDAANKIIKTINASLCNATTPTNSTGNL